MFEKTKALCDSFLDMGIPGFDLMVCKDGECVLRYMNGYSDRENQIRMSGKELYNIYSCSKPITCVAAMQLWEKGLFSLDDKLSDYMPEYAQMTVKTDKGIVPAQNPIRIHHLFEMTSGLNYDVQSPSLRRLRENTNGTCPTREVARAIANEPLSFDPGAQYLYSLAHDVLAALVEIWSGQKFEVYVKEHIFTPLSMTHSDFLLPLEEYQKVVPLYCTSNIKLHPNGNVPMYRLGSEHASGGAGCVSTVEDYMKFIEELRTGERLIKRDTLRLMTTQRLTKDQLATFTLPTHGFGLGMRVPRGDGLRSDFGWGGAAGAYMALDIPNGISLYYVQHVTASPNQTLRPRIYETVVEELTGVALKQPDEAEPIDQNLTY